MIKRVLLFVGLFMFLMPVGNAFAESIIVESPEPYDYKNGLFDDPFIIKNTNLPNWMYDNKLPNTSQNLSSGNYYVEFETPVHLKNFYFHGFDNNCTGRIKLTFQNNKSKTLRTCDFGGPHVYAPIDYKNVERVDLTFYTGIYSREIEFFGKYLNEPLVEIELIDSKTDKTAIKYNYNLPEHYDFIEIEIDGKKYETTNNEFIAKNLEPNKEYEAKFSTYYKAFKSEGIKITTRTESLEEIYNLKAKSKHNRVDLSWDLPESDEFEHVTIYRKMLENNTSSIFNFLVPKTYASDAYDPIFETNGTYFNDLTVEAATGYEYKLTSTHDGKETPGVTVQATTDPPIVEGGGIEKNENGDYVYKWHEPTTGQVKIYVDGNEYATADASDGKITIPADDMKYNGFGDPLVTSQAIAPNGTPGNIGNGSGGTLAGIVLPFEVNDLVESGNSLIYLVGGFVLLALSFLLIPRLIRLIRQSFNSYKNSGQDRRVRG